MLAKIDPLPCPQRQATVCDRDDETGSEHRALDVRRHVVGPFDRVHEGLILGHDPIEGCLHIDANIGVCVLVDRQACRSVLEKHVQPADLDVLDFRDRVENLASDQVKPPAVGPYSD